MPRTFQLICVCLLIAGAGFTVSGQVRDDRVQVGNFDPRAGCEIMERRLDDLFAATSSDVRSIAYVVIHQGESIFDNVVVHRKAVNYARFRRFPADRFRVILTAGRKDISVELWVGKDGMGPLVVASELALAIPDNLSRMQLARDTLHLVKIDGRESYTEFGNPSCLYMFSTSMIQDLLDANEKFVAELQIETKSSKRYKKFVQILTAEFKETGVPVERIRFVYAGRDKEHEGSESKTASVTTTLVRIAEMKL